MKNIYHLLSCPICFSDLTFKIDQAYCTNNNCDCSTFPFPTSNGKFVFVDYQKSILKPEASSELNFSSPIVRNEYLGSVKKALKRFLNGTPKVSKSNFIKAVDSIKLNSDTKILIIGGGTIGEGLESIYLKLSKSIISFDVYNSSNVDFIADAHSIPLKNKSVDLVIIQAVLEHVFDPTKVANECYRVLKDEGVVYAETPFLQGIHEGAYDFTRYTVLGHRILFKKFDTIDTGIIGGSGVSLLWSIEYFARGLFRSVLIGKLVKAIFIWIRWLEYLIPDEFNIDGACGCYFLGRKIESPPEVNPSEYLNEYKGAQ
jgi:hypothetical protein